MKRPRLSPALKWDLNVLRTLARGFVATSLVARGREQEAATRFVDRELARRPKYPGWIRGRMELILGAAAAHRDLEQMAREYCRHTLEEQWGHWRALHRGGWQVATEVEGLEHLGQARAAGKGVILWGMTFCGYLVNKIALQRAGVRLVQLAAADHGAHYPPTRLGLAMVGPLYCRAEDRYLAERVVIPADKSQGYLPTIEARLADNRTVWISGERVGRRRNVEVRLFGRTARYAIGSPRLAFATGARLLPVDVVRDGTFHYRLRIDRPIAPVDGERDGFVEAAVTEFAHRLEQRILEHPADWNWEVHSIDQLLRPAAIC